MIAALDTLEIVKRLKEAGFGDTQAEALTGVLRDAGAAEQGQLATKADIERLAEATKADIERLAEATKADVERLDAKVERAVAEIKAEFALLCSEMAVLRRDVTIRFGGMIVVATGVLLATKFFG
jgi:uncharacterized membrane-anchored protein